MRVALVLTVGACDPPTQMTPEVEAMMERSVRERGDQFNVEMANLRRELLIQATEDADQHMVTLAARLDFNGYYDRLSER